MSARARTWIETIWDIEKVSDGPKTTTGAEQQQQQQQQQRQRQQWYIHMKGRVRENGVHPWEAEQGEEHIEATNLI